jgi:hypothetical protein
MNEPGSEPTSPDPTGQAAPAAAPDASSPPAAAAPSTLTGEGRFERRMESFGREVEDAAQRLSRDPAVRTGVDLAARIWGLVLLALGVWFFLEFTLGYNLPRVPWRDLWPLALILLGGLIVLRGAGRRT